MKHYALLKVATISMIGSLAVFGAYLHEHSKSRRFSLGYTPSEHPFIETNLGELSQEGFILDTGGSFYLKVDDKLASNLPHTYFDRTFTSFNIHGDATTHSQYFLTDIEFMNIKFSQIFFIPHSPDLSQKNQIDCANETAFSKSLQSTKEAHSFIGHRLFNGLNASFDFPKKRFHIFKPGLIPIFDFPYGYFSFVEKIPITYDFNLGIICKIETERGAQSFLIDTGSPVTLITSKNLSPPQSETDQLAGHVFQKFKIGNRNFEKVSAHIIKTLPFENIDGILGMDFLYDKTLFINLQDDYISLR
jgi:hypothetical protein